MAVAYDTSVSGTGSTTLAMTCGASANGLLVFVGLLQGSVTAVTYDGVSMTLVQSAVTPGDPRVYCYRLASPTTGSSKNISVTASGYSSIGIVGISVSGADTSSLVEASTTTNGYGASVTNTVTGTTVGSLVIDGMIGASITTANSGQTSRQTPTVSSPWVLAVSEKAGNGSITTGWNNANNYVGYIQASVKASAAAALDPYDRPRTFQPFLAQ